MAKVKLHRTQMEVAKDTHRFRVICAGRRWGKSVLSQLIILQWATKEVGTYWIVSPTYRQGKQIHWRGLQQIIPQAWIHKKNEVELSITLKNGSVIELKGSENPDALRGVKLRGLVVDEIASIRNWEWLWQEVLRATLTDYQAPALFISTPKGYNHFYEIFQLGQTGTDNNYASWRFTSYDNPYIKEEEINEAKKELTEDTFYQEYMADFRKYTGLVYKEFDRQVHVINAFDISDSWSMYRGVDFGSTNPTAVLWIAVDNDNNWYIVDEHYSTGQTIDYHAGIINANKHNRVVATYGDPSGAQWINEFNHRGVYITPANKEISTNYNSWVRFKIDKVAEKLKVILGKHTEAIPKISQTELGSPSLFIFSNCTNTIREFETYRWKEKSITQAQDLNEPDVPEKANDHCMDALSYFAVSYKKSDPMDREIYGENYKNINAGLNTKWRI
jgi:hypothetical protein